jgi:hypothetical protein
MRKAIPARIATEVRTKHDNDLLTLGRAVGATMYMMHDHVTEKYKKIKKRKHNENKG